MQRIAKKSSLIEVKLICADCKEGRHECAGLWKGLGLEIHCCCSCIRSLDRQGVIRDNSEQKEEVRAKKWNL